MTHDEVLASVRLLSTWRGMKRRCERPRDSAYPDYGGRGIKVCARWSASFEAFLSDMGPKPTPKHSLDRIDNNGDYEPGNCRWATALEQAHNRRRSGRLPVDGEARRHRRHLRLTESDSALADEAAALSGVTASELLRALILDEARRIIEKARKR